MLTRNQSETLKDLKKLQAITTQQLEIINKQIEELEIKNDSEKFRTLEDLADWYEHTDAVSKLELKEEAIKWIKEDIKFGYRLDGYIDSDYLKSIKRWMKRFDITKKDLE